MQTYEKMYRLLFEAVRSNDIRQIIHAAYEIMRRPLIITDTSYVKLTEICPPVPTGDEKWDVYLSGRELDLHSIHNIFECDAINQMKDNYRPCIMDTGYFADSHRLTAPVVRDNTLVGYVSMLVGDAACGEEEIMAISVIADAVAIYLHAQQSKNYDRLSLRRFFARSLMQGDIKGPEEIKKWSSLLGISFSPRYVLLAMAPNRSDRQHFGYYLQDQIEETGLPLLLDPSDSFLYVLLYGTRNRVHSQTIIRELALMMERFQFSCGVSRSFDRLDGIDRYRRQAEIALETGRCWQSETGVHHYRNLALRAMIDAATEKLGPENCCHPALGLLERYDRETDGEYLHTLRVYALSSFSNQETCKELHIHRNTLGYRLGRIEELTGIRLEDRDTRLHLALSFMMELGNLEKNDWL